MYRLEIALRYEFMFGLLINPDPMHDESLIGYLYRLGVCNALWNGEVVKAFKELTNEQVYKWLRLDLRPVSWYEIEEGVRMPKMIDRKIWSPTVLKFCPACLATELYWRELWDITLYTACSVHGIDLLYRCPKCHARINYSVLIAKACDSCGYLIVDSNKSDVFDESRHWLSAELEKRFRLRNIKKLSQIDSLTYEQFCFLACRVGVRALSRIHNVNFSMLEMAARNVAPQIANEAGAVLKDWPEAFHDLLTDFMKIRGSRISSRLGSAFGLIYNDIYIYLKDQCYDFVRVEFESYVVKNWQGPLAMRNRRLSECTLLDHRWLPYKQVALITGLPGNLLRKLQVSGELDSREFSYACGKTTTVVDIKEALRLSLTVHEPLSLRETSRLLCLSRKRIEQLIKDKVLSVVCGDPHVGSKWLIGYSSIVGLIPAKFLPAPCKDFIAISKVAKHYLPTSGGLAELMNAIKSGEVSVFCRTSEESLNIGKWLVSPNELERIRITCHVSSQGKGMSVTNAAKMLGVKAEVAYALVRLGRLRSETVQCSRRTAQVVSHGAVQHFNRNYILAPEIALALNVSVVNVLDLLRERGFLPIAGPNLSHVLCRQYVWRRCKQLKIYMAQEQSFARKKLE